MKTKRLATLLGLMCALTLTGCASKKGDDQQDLPHNDQRIEFEKFSSNPKHSKEFFGISNYNLGMLVNEQKQIQIASIPSAYESEGLIFTSKDTDVASVDDSGNVKALKKGVTQIEVSSLDKECFEVVDVYVNEAIDKADGAALLQAKGATMKEPGYERTRKLKVHEYVQQTLTVDGKDINSAFYVEDIIFSKDDAYFEVYSDDIAIKTADGSPSVSSGKWIFFVDQDSYDTYLLHETPTEKNYMEVHTQKYLGREAYEILYDILDMFFVSGKDIVTDNFDDVDGIGFYDDDTTGLLIDCALHDYTNATEELFSPNGSDVYCHVNITNDDDVITAKEEYSIDIPAGTVYDEDDHYYVFVEGNRVKSFDVKAVMDFEYQGKPSRRTFIRNEKYITDFEVTYPKLAEYTLVDSIYDL